jgi:colicin import membrane protein
MSTQIVEYSQTEAALADLASRYKGVLFDVTTPTGMSEAKRSRAEIRDYRVALEKKRVEIKAPALERCRLIDAEAKRITAELSALEDPIDSQIKVEERKKEEARLAAERAELARIEAEERARKEAEEARMAAERAEIARRQAELDRQEREARERIEAEAQASRQRIEEAERAARLQQEEADRAARASRQAEEDRLRLERELLEAQRREVEEAQREAQRKAAEVMDARSMLRTFRDRFGHLKQFAGVVKAIDALPKKVTA